MLDGAIFRLKARASTTKNGREAVLPLAPGIAEALRNAPPEPQNPVGRVFASKLPRAERVSLDYQKAGIPRIDTAGRHADFHLLRYTFCTRLVRSGETLAVAMALMRHSDPKLTMKIYTDVGLLPTSDAILALPNLVPTLEHNTPENTPEIVTTGPTPSNGVLSSQCYSNLEAVAIKAISPGASAYVIPNPEKEDGARCRVRTCDFSRRGMDAVL